MIGAQIGTLIANTNFADLYNRAVREPLETLDRARPGMRALILIDALDHALSFGAPNIVTLLAGSDDLPPGIRFVMAEAKRLPRASANPLAEALLVRAARTLTRVPGGPAEPIPWLKEWARFRTPSTFCGRTTWRALSSPTGPRSFANSYSGN